MNSEGFLIVFELSHEDFKEQPDDEEKDSMSDPEFNPFTKILPSHATNFVALSFPLGSRSAAAFNSVKSTWRASFRMEDVPERQGATGIPPEVSCGLTFVVVVFVNLVACCDGVVFTIC